MIIATAVIPALLVAVVLLSIVSVANLLRQHSRTRQLVIGLQTEQEQLAQANDRLAHVAAHDSLTELFNRQGIIDHLELEIDRSRDSHKIAVLFMDVDRFKSINDSLGHGAGDQLLQVIGRRIRTVMPSGCIAGRLGGDEFVIVIDEASDISRVSDVAHRLAQVMSEPLELSGRLVRISVSIGVAIGPDANDTASELIGFANVALHRAKDAGRDRVEIFTSDIRVEMQRRAAEERSLRLAIDAGDVVPFFQPAKEQSCLAFFIVRVILACIMTSCTVFNLSYNLPKNPNKYIDYSQFFTYWSMWLTLFFFLYVVIVMVVKKSWLV